MNWVIRSTKTVKFHTNLHEILKPIWNDLTSYNWNISDLYFLSDSDIPISFEQDFFILDHQQFEQIYNSRTQIIWGIMAAIPGNTEPDVTLISTLYADDSRVWEPNHIFVRESMLEITAFDSGYTIVKFKDQDLSDKFKDYFQEQAIELQKFNEKYIN
ncbi:uncharacterized protein CHSO_3689 [Chryseobacterium sp. StRB126]|uniref:hypothetical protein n=1 Tax=Chryseobacterium sp. StRB126 TaxID=878220 RepID=UPI0004E998EA|nr:hypothetical protein [Chryseobacterium sp. StRB126]BAP32726.1 uncharacterized protein CHSO_3689 [Chryseobacterium sp. StRB126]